MTVTPPEPFQPGLSTPNAEQPSGQSVPPPAPVDGGMAAWGAAPEATNTANPVLGIGQAVGLAVAGAVVWSLLLDYAHLSLSLIAVVVGGLVGSILARHLRPSPQAAVLAVVLTVLACLVGQVAGTYGYLVRHEHVPLSLVREKVSISDVLRHGTNALTYLFVALGAFYAFSAAMGNARRFGGFGGGRRYGRR